MNPQSLKPGDQVFVASNHDGAFARVVEVRGQSVELRCVCGHQGEYPLSSVQIPPTFDPPRSTSAPPAEKT